MAQIIRVINQILSGDVRHDFETPIKTYHAGNFSPPGHTSQIDSQIVHYTSLRQIKTAIKDNNTGYIFGMHSEF